MLRLLSLLAIGLLLSTSCSDDKEVVTATASESKLKPYESADREYAATAIIDSFCRAKDTVAIANLTNWIIEEEKEADYADPGLAYAYYRRGAKLYKTDKTACGNDYRESISRYLAADSLNLSKIVRLRINLANVTHQVDGPLDSIIYHVDQGLDLLNSYPDYPFETKEWFKLYRLAGMAYEERGDLKNALTYLEAGSQLSDASEPEDALLFRGRVETEYGWALAGNGQLNKAAERLDLAIAYETAAKKKNYLADAYRYYCEVHFLRKDYKKMEVAARISLDHTTGLGSDLEANDLNNLGSALLHQGKLAEGRKYLLRALEIYRKIGLTVPQGHTFENLAEIASQKNNLVLGIDYLQQAEQVYHGIPELPGLENALNPAKMVEATIERARYTMRLHEQDSILLRLPGVELAAAQVDSLLGLLRYSFRSEESKRRLAAKLRPFQEELFDLSVRNFARSGDDRYLDLGLHYLARSKAQILNEQRLRYRQIEDPELKKTIYSIDNELRLLTEEYLTDSINRTEILTKLNRKQLERKELLDDAFAQTSLVFSGLPERPEAIIIQSEVAKNAAALDYFVGDSLVFAGVYTSSDLSLIKLDITVLELREHIIKVNEFLRAPSTNRYQNNRKYRDSIEANYIKSSNDLYRTLLPEEITSGGYKQLTILLDGPLHQLPFATLITDIVPVAEIGNHSVYPFLLKEYVTNYEFSLQTWLERIKNPKTYPTDQLVVAPTQPKSVTLKPAGSERQITLASLTTSEVENQQVADLIDARTLRKTGANRAKFMRIASNYGVIHFAGHGVANADDPYQSFLVFSESNQETTDNDLMYLRDLERLQLQADLLVLSACQTAEGELSQGEGVISLGRAGALAGAGSVVASNWAVNQEAKAAFFPLFYEQLIAGQRRDVAIQQAKLQLIQTDERFGHPYYWAGFENFGDGGVVESLQ